MTTSYRPIQVEGPGAPLHLVEHELRDPAPGDTDISIRAIGEAAGVTAPTLYHHFGDKEGLLAAVVDFGWDNHLEFARHSSDPRHPVLLARV